MEQHGKLDCSAARKIDLVEYLEKLGHRPVKIRGVDYWYLSPLREEKTASFKVNIVLNAWYDHGLGKGGNLIDFAILYHNCTIGELLHQLNVHGLLMQRPEIPMHTGERAGIEILRESSITSFSLVKYLNERRIPQAIANAYCKEVRWRMKSKEYYGIGFQNDLGGYELRTPFLKTSSSPKGVTSIHNGSTMLTVFEGFFDFLSFVLLMQLEPGGESDFLILNSLAFFERSLSFMEQYERVRLFLDNDDAGQNCSAVACKKNARFTNESRLYAKHKDLNAWLVHVGLV